MDIFFAVNPEKNVVALSFKFGPVPKLKEKGKMFFGWIHFLVDIYWGQIRFVAGYILRLDVFSGQIHFFVDTFCSWNMLSCWLMFTGT